LNSIPAIDNPSSEDSRLDFFNYELEEVELKVGGLTGKKYHGGIVSNFVYRHGLLDIDQMSSLSFSVRELLKTEVSFDLLTIKKRLVSIDGTVKFLFELEGKKGPQEIEAVYIPEKTRVTLCVSSQVGCKMGCRFCLTAQLGFKEHLMAGDIVRQVMTVNADPELRPVTNIVFMGMGEPFDNLVEVRKACRILTHHRGLNLSARKITVSTVGLVDKIDALTPEDPFRLAVSLNSSDDSTRSDLMPVNRRWAMDELLESCRQYAKRTNKRITFEYILMAGLTDRDIDVDNLVRKLSPIPCKLNLIPYNESSFTEFKRPTEEDCLRFHSKLMARAAFPVFIRKNRGNDIFAACGMLKKVDPTEKRSPETPPSAL
jgi:23S rRNA (adenine2503-C2)-methyltransferase